MGGYRIFEDLSYICDMKRFLITLALACLMLSAFAQNRDIPAGMRMELSELTQDKNQYSIFTYKDADGTFGYYLSLGRVLDLLEIFGDGLGNTSLSHIDATCLWLGATPEEAGATLDALTNLFDEDPGVTAEFPCRLTNGAEGLTDHDTATCTVVKRFLQGKRLLFVFKSGSRTAEADLTKPGLKTLRWGTKL